MKNLRTIAVLGISISMAVSGPAQAKCWTPAEVDSASVRDLQSRLMVAALRCGKSNHDLLPDYNQFVKSKRHLISSSNTVLKKFFAHGRSGKAAMREYDRYAVKLANRYGAGSGDLSECQAMKSLAQSAASSSGHIASLVELANQQATDPHLPGGRCGIEIAANTN